MTFTLGTRAISAGYRLAAFESIGSTNAEALSRAREGERGPIWLVTSEQTAGRGRRLRPWIAPRGNLAGSVLEALDVTPQAAATLGFAAGLALEAALGKVSRRASRRAHTLQENNFLLKWPNDVMAARAKLAGILLEAEPVLGDLLAVVVGIGTNVVAAPDGLPTPATSLRALGIEISAEELFVALSDSWVKFREIWDLGRGFGEIRKLWLEHAMGLGEPVTVNTGGATIAGNFDTLDDTGCMIVKTPAGDRIPVSAGDVFFGSAASTGAA
jgi:BirA family transcriptional regulator, biotin operon repressor / biotin---[acetyl-CoA-carboxylase] ligase